MNLIHIYDCFCDETRLRILNLLAQTPLCVCHFQALLGEPQVKISKHLAYLKAKGVVHCVRQRNWMVYSLPAKPAPELRANLKCLQDCIQTHPVFRQDLKRLAALRPRLNWLNALCCHPRIKPGRAPGPSTPPLRLKETAGRKARLNK